jgi:hypothetical protein
MLSIVVITFGILAGIVIVSVIGAWIWEWIENYLYFRRKNEHRKSLGLDSNELQQRHRKE